MKTSLVTLNLNKEKECSPHHDGVFFISPPDFYKLTVAERNSLFEIFSPVSIVVMEDGRIRFFAKSVLFTSKTKPVGFYHVIMNRYEEFTSFHCEEVVSAELSGFEFNLIDQVKQPNQLEFDFNPTNSIFIERNDVTLSLRNRNEYKVNFVSRPDFEVKLKVLKIIP